MFADIVGSVLMFLAVALGALIIALAVYFVARWWFPEAEKPIRWIVGAVYLLALIVIAYYSWTGRTP